MNRNCILMDLGLVEYRQAWELQKSLVVQRLDGNIQDALLLLEHPPVYTVGRRGTPEGLEELGLPVYEVERGGDVTYHGPGQLVGYPILALPGGKLDVKRYVTYLEEVLIGTAADFGVTGHRGAHAGVWVGPRKLASIGIAVKHYVTYHGFALNVNTDLTAFRKIKPCGIEGSLITSMEEVLGGHVPMEDVKASLLRHFSWAFRMDMRPSGETLREYLHLMSRLQQ